MTDHPESSLSPADMLRLAENEQRAAILRFSPDDRLLYSVWGVAWGVGFFARWVTSGNDPIIDASAASGWIYAALLALAMIVTVLHIHGRVTGIRGRSEAIGQRHGISWLVAFAAYGLMIAGLGRADVEYEISTVIASVLPVFIVGVMYMAGAALWDDRLQFALGAWLTFVAGVSAVAWYPGHYLVLAIGGGGGFFVGAVLAARRPRPS